MVISTPPITSTERQSNIELLRILAMVMIVAHHFAVHSGLPIWSGHGANVFWAQFLCMQGKVGVDLFVLITGYFLVEKPGRMTSVLHLLIETAFYGVVLYLLFVAAGHATFDWQRLKSATYPGGYWFIACYMALFAVSPFLGRMLRSLNEEQYRWLVIVSVAYLTLSWLPGSGYFKGPLITFVVLFVIGGYFRRFSVAERFGWLWPVLLTAGAAVFLSAHAGYVDYAGRPGKFFSYSDIHHLPTIAISVGFFWLFAKMRLGYSPVVNRVAACTLGVYLIHDNAYVRPWLWHQAIHVAKHVRSDGFILWSIGMVLLVFAVCTAVEYGRQRGMTPVVKRLLRPLKSLDEAVKKKFG